MNKFEIEPLDITPSGDLEIHTFVGEHDPSWGKPLLGQVSHISGIDMSGTDNKAFQDYRNARSELSKKRQMQLNLRSI